MFDPNSYLFENLQKMHKVEEETKLKESNDDVKPDIKIDSKFLKKYSIYKFKQLDKSEIDNESRAILYRQLQDVLKFMDTDSKNILSVDSYFSGLAGKLSKYIKNNGNEVDSISYGKVYGLESFLSLYTLVIDNIKYKVCISEDTIYLTKDCLESIVNKYDDLLSNYIQPGDHNF